MEEKLFSVSGPQQLRQLETKIKHKRKELVMWSCFIDWHYLFEGASGISCHDKQIILETHNRLRQMLALGQIRGQPPALDMRELVGFPSQFSKNIMSFFLNSYLMFQFFEDLG